MAKRRPIKKSEQARSRCMRVRGTKRGKLTLCVEGRRYGFVATLTSPHGNKLPVPTGRARTLESATKNAKRFLAKQGIIPG